jgi:protein TonB
MRWAIPASLGVHVGLIAFAWVMLQGASVDEALSEGEASIEIFSIEMAVEEPSEVVSESSVETVSAGADTEVPETVEPEPVETVQPEPEPVVAAEAVPVEPVEELVSASVLSALSEVESEIAAPLPVVADDSAMTVASVAVPEVVEELADTPPLPKPRIVRKPVELERAEKPVEKKPVEQPKKQPEPPVEKPKKTADKQPAEKPKKVANLGNGGEAEADSKASKAAGGKGAKSGGGGDADAYPGKVYARLTKAVKRPSGRFTGGEVRIMFTLDASGRVLKSALSQSSGDPKVDKAAIDAVARAKFPPIPESAGKSSWPFTFPLVIKN